VRTTI